MSDTNDTPMMKQYHTVKEQYKDMILFYRMGDFYEMFYDDAYIASQVLGIALTSRNKGENPIPMAGIPVKAIDNYLPKLLAKEYKVAICEQLQDASMAQGLVDRDVVRIITPGTITETDVLSDKYSNYLLSIHICKDIAGLAWGDISTGQLFVQETQPSLIPDEIARIAPAECIISETERDIKINFPEGTQTLEETIQMANIPLTCRPEWFFQEDTGRRNILQQFQIQTLESYGCEKMSQALGAAGAWLKYIEETQKTTLKDIATLRAYDTHKHMFLDKATRHCLEIHKTMRDGKKQGTLLSILDYTQTSMGSRLLQEWIATPLIDVLQIQLRQQAISELLKYPEELQNLQKNLSLIQDIERIAAKIAYQRANARDLLSLKNSLQITPNIAQILENFCATEWKRCYQQLISLDELTNLLEKAIHPDPKIALKDGDIIRDGFHPELDELRNLQINDEEWLRQYEFTEIQQTNIPTLKVGYNRIFGYYIEVTNAQSHKIPNHYIRKQTLKNAERYITPELKEHEEKILSSTEKAKALEYELFLAIREKIANQLQPIRDIASAIAEIDVFLSLTYVAKLYNYICPEIDQSFKIEIQEGRHPVLDVTLKGNFIANDISIAPGRNMIIITGPNMAGKSTYIRQCALLILMAQIGSYIPAKQAHIGIVDRIFTRIGASDELTRGRSTFMVEMIETANILNNATDRSFIALDEVGRGTSTFDGISLAWAIMEHIQKNITARTLFATHYHEMAALEEIYPNIHNYNVSIKEWGENITFLYKIVRGAADKSYGIHVARLAGIPREVLKRGREILHNLKKNGKDFQSYTKSCCKNPIGMEDISFNLFTMVGEDIIDTLKNLDLNNVTPMEAMEILRELQEDAKKL
ncbi:MAG TPA: DNA mismatch repair protein MutS [Planctomycetota bacterium]|jgi:DNA mismatch repair protein MutS|nr:DNA mismatch repair protein MutS [Planctomycetota bacterium]HQB00536.1 DNA mismatch repair protein MutS [Planctomycetota bacterium]